MLSKEELLKPRYKVIAAYPHMEMDQHSVGDIISPYGMGFIYPDKVKEQYDGYPHLFKPLQWWEEREEKDMPEYVRWVKDGTIRKVSRWDMETTSSWFMFLDNEVIPYAPGGSALDGTHFLPSDESEYTIYLQSLK